MLIYSNWNLLTYHRDVIDNKAQQTSYRVESNRSPPLKVTEQQTNRIELEIEKPKNVTKFN